MNLRRLGVLCALALWLAVAASAQPRINSVLNGASFKPLVSAGSAVSIFGRELSDLTLAATEVPLPVSLAGVTVEINGIEAPLYFVSPRQINVQIPAGIDTGTIEVVVVTARGRSEPFMVPLLATAPGIFTRTSDGEGAPLLLNTAFQVIDTVAPGQRVILYAVGLGPTNPPVATGEGGSLAEPLNRVVELPEVYIGGQRAVVEFAGTAPGFVGVYQLNVVAAAAFSNDLVFLVAGGRRSKPTEISAAVPPVVNGSGAVVSETRTVEAFQRMQLFAIASVRVTVGAELSELRIDAEDNLIGLVSTEVRDGALQVTSSGPYTTTTAVEISISVPTLDRIEHLGVGDLIVEGVTGEQFEAFHSGVGRVILSGTVESLDLLWDGFGTAELFDLEATRARVLHTRVGTIRVNVSDSLFARLYGVGDIIYRGSPGMVDAEVQGTGSIQPE